MESLSEINKHIKIIKKLIKLNSKIFYYKNINYFPFVKLAIASEDFNNTKKNDNKRNNNFFSKIKFILNFPFILVNSFFYKKYFKKNLKKKDVVFFSDIGHYNDKYNKKQYNSFIDPYFKKIKKKYKSIKIEIVPHWYKRKKNKLFQPLYLKFLYLDLIKIFFFKIKRFYFFREIKFYKDLEILLKKHSINIESKSFQEKFDQIYFYSQLLETIIKKINPKTVFLACYYNDMNLSVVLACKRLNIKTVDIQHGGFEPEHYLYRYWQNSAIKKGYELLPDFFWIWHENLLIDKFYYKNKNHKIITGGKYLIENMNKIFNDVYKNFSIHERYFFKFIRRYKKRILFCATSDLPKCLVETIKISQKNKDWVWIIRLHPRHSNHKRIQQQLFKEKISLKRIIIQDASKINLYFMIKKSSDVLIDQSSIALDAFYLKKPIVILNNYKNLYKTYKKIKLCNFSNEPLKIIYYIKKNNLEKNFNFSIFSRNSFSLLKKNIFN
jgi:hypothetical protein